MKQRWKVAGGLLLAVLLVGGYAGYRLALGQPFSLNQLADRQALIYLVRNPELFTTVGIADGTLFDRHSGRLAEVGLEKRDADYALLERFVGEVRQFDRASLGHQDQITYDVLLQYYGAQLALKRYAWLSSEGLYPITPFWGGQAQLPNFLQSQHVVKNAKTARNYVARLEALAAKLDGLTAEMQRQAAAGVVPPLALIEKVELGINDTLRPAPAHNPLVTTFVARMDKVRDLDGALKSALAEQAASALRERVYPAYARMAAALASHKAAAAGQGAGVGRLPQGAAYYAAMLHQMTTSDDPPQRIHALGLAEVERISAEMDTLLRANGLASGTVAARMHALQADPRFLYANSDAGREQALERYRRILAEVNARMPEYFRSLPPGRLEVVRVPAAAEKGSAGAYYEPAAMDGSRPGRFFANLRDLAEVPQWGMKTLAYHEGIPGHHFQVSTAQGLKGLPLLRQQSVYTAYTEGWALYAERLAAEIGMYRDDPWGDLGRLQAELFRAVRLVVDTGLHAEGWSREQAIAYMADTTGINTSAVVSEIERYMGMPGQACAYKVGQLKILELRARARAALGAKFDLKDFHAVVLGSGSLPLTVLERLVDEWIAASGGR
jgi:uncharacterized protein (DUF885 family)